MKFSEISEGKKFTLGPVLVTEAEIMQFAGNYDDQWFHTDPVRAEQGPFHGLIASGWHTCALAMQMVSRQILAGSESYASPGLAYVKWPNPLRPGDVLTLKVLVLESRISASRPWLGLVRWQWIMLNQSGQQVLDLEATSMFKIGEELAA